jgi:hypothetical protein
MACSVPMETRWNVTCTVTSTIPLRPSDASRGRQEVTEAPLAAAIAAARAQMAAPFASTPIPPAAANAARSAALSAL